jgi:trans-aconitate 2-methyltransferase
VWDPRAYLRFGDERSRPFFDLLSRVEAANPRVVVDLGCGPGTLTVTLAERWPDATIVGLDSSVDMVNAARGLGSSVHFDVADVRDFHPEPEVDIVVGNAVLQWVPGHDALLERWVNELQPGAWIAFQVPGNFDAPSHRIIREVAADYGLEDRLRGTDAVLEPVAYATLLTDVGRTVDAWETTYVHRLPVDGPEHPVLRWVEGTALRPVRAALDEREWVAYRAELERRLRDAYPVHNGLVFFPFRRIFVVARPPFPPPFPPIKD